MRNRSRSSVSISPPAGLRRSSGPSRAGVALAELLAALALLGLIVAVTLPAMGGLLRKRSLAAAGATLAGEIARIRHEAIARRRHVGIAFERTPGADRYSVYVDGGRQGILAAEIASGLDQRVRGPVDIGASFAGIRLGIPGPGRIPKIPPGRGVLVPGSDPVQFGGTDIVSFSPQGESSSGAVYLMDRGGELRAVVVYGRTGRIREWAFNKNANVWRQ